MALKIGMDIIITKKWRYIKRNKFINDWKWRKIWNDEWRKRASSGAVLCCRCCGASPSAYCHRCITRNKELLHGGGFLVPHAGQLSPGVAEFATFTPTLPPLRSAATAQQLRTEGREHILVMISYSESTRPRRRYSLHLIYFSGAHGHTTAGPPQSLRGSRRRGRIVPVEAYPLYDQQKQRGNPSLFFSHFLWQFALFCV